jgi:uracil-DNA glycosylase
MHDIATLISARDAASLIGWWQDAGVDSFVDEMSTPWLGRTAPKLSQRHNDASIGAAQKLELPRAAEALPATLADFTRWFLSSTDIPEAGPATFRVAPSGNPEASLMALVDMPEAGDTHEVLSGEVGNYFNNMLSALKRDRTTTYIAALTPSRVPTGILPEAALPRLGEIARHHIALAAPKRVWLMGDAVSRAVLGMDVVSARGRQHNINHQGSIMIAVASYHPRFLFRNPRRKADAWADMQLLIEGIDA